MRPCKTGSTSFAPSFKLASPWYVIMLTYHVTSSQLMCSCVLASLVKFALILVPDAACTFLPANSSTFSFTVLFQALRGRMWKTFLGLDAVKKPGYYSNMVTKALGKSAAHGKVQMSRWALLPLS